MQPRRLLAYARVSGSEQGRTGTSLDGQREEIERYAKAQGYPRPIFFVEVASAGAERLDGRPKLRALLDEVRDGDLVVVAKQDRWSRNTLFYLQSTKQIVERGARFFSLAERFDPSTPEGVFAATIMAAVAEQERQRIVDRTVGRRKELRAQGLWIEGPAPFGYRVERRALVVVEDAAIVRELFARCIAGESTSRLVVWLRDKGLARLAYKKSVHSMLRARWYLGELQTVAGVWQKAHAPIVDVDTFERAQAALASRRLGGMTPRPDSRTADWLGRGLLSCARCGARMGPVYRQGRKGGETHYYACGSRVRKHACDAQFLRVDKIDPQLATLAKARLVELREELGREDTPAPASKLGDIQARVDRLTSKRERTIDLITDGTLDGADGRERLRKIDIELRELAATTRVEEAKTKAARPAVRAAVLRDVEQLARAWRLASPAARRTILQRLTNAVSVDGDSIKPAWKTLAELALEVGSPA
jgi:DNA invertase Pin-like site-specific DNA recombinase